MVVLIRSVSVWLKTQTFNCSAVLTSNIKVFVECLLSARCSKYWKEFTLPSWKLTPREDKEGKVVINWEGGPSSLQCVIRGQTCQTC